MPDSLGTLVNTPESLFHVKSDRMNGKSYNENFKVYYLLSKLIFTVNNINKYQTQGFIHADTA